MTRDEPTRLIPSTHESAQNDIGPRTMSNPSYVAETLWLLLGDPSSSTSELRRLLTDDSPYEGIDALVLDSC